MTKKTKRRRRKNQTPLSEEKRRSIVVELNYCLGVLDNIINEIKYADTDDAYVAIDEINFLVDLLKEVEQC